MPHSDTDFTIGEDLYGVSIAELNTRIDVLKNEISRIEVELTKKQAEFSAADQLFGQKPGNS
ncbi:MAG: DUF1192 family protein [Maricaulaceae bacterium]